MSDIKTSIIVAVSRNDCIGQGNDLPWYIPSDLKRTKEITMGKPLIMGRLTYESITARRGGKPLPGRQSIIISRNMERPDFENVFVAASLEDAIRTAREIALQNNQNEIIIFGGAQIYQQALPQTERIYLTKVEIDIADGDAFFPPLPEQEWHECSREEHQTDDGLSYAYVLLERGTP